MIFRVNRWGGLGCGLLGLSVGFSWGTHFSAAKVETGRAAAGGILEPEDTYVNAVGFRADLRRFSCIDTVLTREPFYRRTIRLLWANAAGVEALAVPPPGAGGHYYLIRGDSITQLQLSPRRARFDSYVSPDYLRTP